MRAAITRRRLGLAAALVVTITSAECFRGTNLTDPGGGGIGFRASDPHVTVITLSPTSVKGVPGSTVQILAAPQDSSGKAIASDFVAWMSSDPSVATVSGSGAVTLVRRGTAAITAIADGVTASVGTDVTNAPPASVNVAPSTTLIQTGQTAQMTATVLDASGGVDSGATVTWTSSNPGIATVTSTGLVSAIAVGTVTITAASGGVTGTASVQVVASAPTVASVTVTPSNSTLYPSSIAQLTATLRDASGHIVSGFTVAWSTSDPSVATVSSHGVVTANAVGSATITAAAGGKSGNATVNVRAPVVASVTVAPGNTTLAPGQTVQLVATPRDASGSAIQVAVSWSTSNSAVARVSSSGLVTAAAMGEADITATAGGVNGISAVTVDSGPSGGFHEPSGMAVQINTGTMTRIPSSFSMFSPSTPSAQAEWSGNLSVVPGGTGLRITYPTNLPGGYSPVRFGTTVKSPGTGWYYQRMQVRFSPNWTLNGNVQLKLCEPRTQQTGSGQTANENHVIAVHDFQTQSTHAWFYVLLQGPNGNFRNLFEQPQYTPAANLNDGKWHTVEALFGPESSPGAGDGSYNGWVDGVQVEHYTNVLWLAPGNQIGWPYLLFDPTYGGGPHSPPQSMYWEFDQLYVSTK